MNKKCCRCGDLKPPDDFARQTDSRDGRQAMCKPCARLTFKAWFQTNRSRQNVKDRVRTRRLRLEMLQVYGQVCACCGEEREEFLTLDHVHGGGNEHRRRVGSGVRVYRDLKRRGWPRDGFQVLCYNCNCAHGRCGYCPHSLSRDPQNRVTLFARTRG